MADPRQLANRLQEFQEALERFDRELKEQLGELNAVWARVDRVWEGDAYQEFAGSWQSIMRRMGQYVDSARKYEAFLQERIEALRNFENSGGIS